VAPRADWHGDSQGELVLAHNHRCPVCAGTFQASPKGNSGFAEEFLECLDCGLSLHDSLLSHEQALSQHVSTHGQGLQRRENEGMRARALLLRRQNALRKVHALLKQAEEKERQEGPARP
jgi:hypothetical protein